MTTLLTIQKLSVKLQDKVVLSSLDLTLNEGDILGLVGASGCGKTTLLNAIAGFCHPSHGKILINDKTLSDAKSVIAAEQREVGMIFQDYALFPHLSVKENIAFGISKLSKTEQSKKITHLLSILKLTDYENSYIHQLSGGQQQRVAIARALAPQPKLLLLDEPFSNIDARLRNELMIEIRQLLKQFKTTAIFVTHNKDEVFTFADKMAVMADGKLLQLDAPNIICRQPNSYQVADFLQLGSWLPCFINGGVATSLLGDHDINREQGTLSDTEATTAAENDGEQSHLLYLLVKPQQLTLNTNLNGAVNAQVEYISVTEQGYHYNLRSLESADNKSSNTQQRLSFSKLSLYSEMELSINQQVEVNIEPVDALIFQKPL